MSNGNRDELSRRLRKLPRSLEPAADLWPRIEEAIDRGAGAPHARMRQRMFGHTWLRMAAAAAAVVVVAVGVLFFPGSGLLGRESPDATHDVEAEAHAVLRREVAKLTAEVREAERIYQRARRELVDGLRRMGGTASLETLALLESQFAQTDKLIGKLWEEARENPELAEPVYQLAALYDIQTGAVTQSANYVLGRGR